MILGTNTVRIWQPASGAVSLDGVGQIEHTPWKVLTGYISADFLKDSTSPVRGVRYPQGVFMLPPHSNRYLTGLLARAGGREILGLGTYMAGGHSGIGDVLKNPRFAPVEAILWGGEILLDNPSGETAVGVLRAVNNTSGYLHGYRTAPHSFQVDNQTTHLLNMFRTRTPFFVPDHVQEFTFDHSRQHLFSALDRTIETGSGLAINFRHGLGGCLQAVGSLLWGIEEGRKEEVMGLFKGDVETAKSFCDVLLATDPFDATVLESLSHGFAQILEGKDFEETELRTLRDAFEILADYYRINMSCDLDNEYDVIL